MNTEILYLLRATPCASVFIRGSIALRYPKKIGLVTAAMLPPASRISTVHQRD